MFRYTVGIFSFRYFSVSGLFCSGGRGRRSPPGPTQPHVKAQSHGTDHEKVGRGKHRDAQGWPKAAAGLTGRQTSLVSGREKWETHSGQRVVHLAERVAAECPARGDEPGPDAQPAADEMSGWFIEQDS